MLVPVHPQTAVFDPDRLPWEPCQCCAAGDLSILGRHETQLDSYHLSYFPKHHLN